MVGHACHPSYEGGWDGEDGGSKPTQAKMFTRLHLNKKKLSVIMCAFYPSDGKKQNRIMVQAA
jgi:hypothetical protein